MEACSPSPVGHGEEGVAAVRGKWALRERASFGTFALMRGSSLYALVYASMRGFHFPPFNAARATVQKQLLELRRAMFVYY